MRPFTTKYAEQLLNAHQPNQIAYLCSEIGLEPNAENAVEIDAAYRELVERGLVEEMTGQNVMVYYGGRSRHPFKLIDR